MMVEKYLARLKEIITSFDRSGVNRYFVFGSSTRENYQFRPQDIDIAVVGNNTSHLNLANLRDTFYDSTIPYKVDVVDFDEASKDFRDYVLANENIVWIT